MHPWRQYQEDAAEFFRSLGLEAATDVSVTGVRTAHDVDVLVRSHHVGFDVTWIVECKRWSTPVTKLHVLALREIVADTGSDRGILLCEVGFQSGAVEAANLTNIQLSSLQALRTTTTDSVNSMRVRELFDRVTVCRERYWGIPKEDRIRHGLRSAVGEHDYSGAQVIECCEELLGRALRGTYPFVLESIGALFRFGRERSFVSAGDVVAEASRLISELEEKLTSVPPQ